MKVFIHIGTHKTGTSSIQAFLRKEQATLGTHSFLVPVSGTVHKRSGHHNLAWEQRADSRFNPKHGGLADLISELAASRAQTAIISSEDFEYLVDRPELLTQFERSLLAAGHEVHYILFLRRADDYAYSLYGQLSRFDFDVPFRRFVLNIIRHGKVVTAKDRVFYFDYAAFVRKWRSVSQGSLVVVNFDTAARGTGILPAFLTAVGVPDDVKMKAVNAKVRNKRGRSNVPRAEKMIAGWLLRLRFPEKRIGTLTE